MNINRLTKPKPANRRIGDHSVSELRADPLIRTSNGLPPPLSFSAAICCAWAELSTLLVFAACVELVCDELLVSVVVLGASDDCNTTEEDETVDEEDEEDDEVEVTVTEDDSDVDSDFVLVLVLVLLVVDEEDASVVDVAFVVLVAFSVAVVSSVAVVFVFDSLVLVDNDFVVVTELEQTAGKRFPLIVIPSNVLELTLSSAHAFCTSDCTDLRPARQPVEQTAPFSKSDC